MQLHILSQTIVDGKPLYAYDQDEHKTKIDVLGQTLYSVEVTTVAVSSSCSWMAVAQSSDLYPGCN